MAIDPIPPLPPVPVVPAPRPSSYRVSYYAAVAVFVLGVMIGAAQVAHTDLGISTQTLALLGVAASGLGALAGFLPRINKPPAPDRKGLD